MSLLTDFAIQLYSLREETAQDFGAVLSRLGDMGYTGVEFAGYGDLPAPVMRRLLDENQLQSVGSHVSMDRLIHNLEEELEYNKILGTDYLIVPWTEVKTREDVQNLAADLLDIAPKVKAAGFGFAYHNHDHELAMDKDQTLMDILLELVPANLMDWELDLYWAACAGLDIMQCLKQYAHRIKLLHLKQLLDYESQKCVDLDEGVLDFAGIIQVAQKNGVKHYILEQEAFAISPYHSVEKGYQHIMSL